MKSEHIQRTKKDPFIDIEPTVARNKKLKGITQTIRVPSPYEQGAYNLPFSFNILHCMTLKKLTE